MSDTTTTTPTREKFKKEMEETKAGFHQLLDSLSGEDFKKKSGNATDGRRNALFVKNVCSTRHDTPLAT